MSKHLTTLALMIALIWSTAAVTIAYASPLPQDPRPSDEGGGSGGGGSDSGGGDSADSGSAASRCALVEGEVIHWGVGAMGGIGSKLSTGSWEVDATSSSNGTYSFGGLGTGIATLQVVLPPAMDDSPIRSSKTRASISIATTPPSPISPYTAALALIRRPPWKCPARRRYRPALKFQSN